MMTLMRLVTLFILSLSICAGEITGAGKVVDSILKKNGLSRAKLSMAGLKVKLGEVTGAGRIHVDDLSHLVTDKALLNVNNLQHVEYKYPSQGKYTGEVKEFIFPRQKVKKSKVLAYITK